MALLIRESVAWQKKKDRSKDGADIINSSMMPQSNMVLPLPGSPLIQRSRLSL